ncbi:unnamed protein product [Closterium sp. Yama58-4]|nr:unnamed protein product [Closterium sp. Yama58-4]
MRCSECGMVSQQFREEDNEGGAPGAGGGAAGTGGMGMGMGSQAVVRESNVALHQQRQEVAAADAARAAQAVSLQVQSNVALHQQRQDVAAADAVRAARAVSLQVQVGRLGGALSGRQVQGADSGAHGGVGHAWREGDGGAGGVGGGGRGEDGWGGEAKSGGRRRRGGGEMGGEGGEALQREMAGWGMEGGSGGFGGMGGGAAQGACGEGRDEEGKGAGGSAGQDDEGEWARELRAILAGTRRSRRQEREEARKRARQARRKKWGRFGAELAAIREDEAAERRDGGEGEGGNGMGVEGEGEEEEGGKGGSEKASMRETWFALAEKLQTSPFSAVTCKLHVLLPLHASLALLFLALHCSSSPCIALPRLALLFLALHCSSSPCIALPRLALLFLALHRSSSPCMPSTALTALLLTSTYFPLSPPLLPPPLPPPSPPLPSRHLPLHTSLASLFLACHYLRLPLLPTDICHLALSGSLPYLSAWRQLPPFQGYPASVPPATLFRPLALCSARLLELLAASAAASIALRVPALNFRLIGERFLQVRVSSLQLPLTHFLHLPAGCAMPLPRSSVHSPSAAASSAASISLRLLPLNYRLIGERFLQSPPCPSHSPPCPSHSPPCPSHSPPCPSHSPPCPSHSPPPACCQVEGAAVI